MHSDPIADMLTRIRNALMNQSPEVKVPRSNIKVEIARILQEEGYIESYSVDETFPATITLKLKYYGPRRQRRPVITGLERVSKPGRRVYVNKFDVPWVMSGMGIAIMSTSQGLMTDQKARRVGIGGEVICHVY
ncbi:MAG: 30S ribosomal protein S8 [Anaerolineales bacterium]